MSDIPCVCDRNLALLLSLGCEPAQALEERDRIAQIEQVAVLSEDNAREQDEVIARLRGELASLREDFEAACAALAGVEIGRRSFEQGETLVAIGGESCPA